MLSLRTRVFIIVNLIILFILGVSVLLLVISKRRQIEEQKTSAGNQTTDGATSASVALPSTAPAPNAPAPASPRQPTTLEAEQMAVRQLAKVFIERYSTYSTDNNFQNIRDIEPLATAELWKKLSARIGAAAAQPFVGVTTVVLGSTLADWQEARATAELKTKQTTDKNGTITQAYRTVLVMMVKQGSGWLVEKFEWQ